jgi:hypothetical protein
MALLEAALQFLVVLAALGWLAGVRWCWRRIFEVWDCYRRPSPHSVDNPGDLWLITRDEVLDWATFPAGVRADFAPPEPAPVRRHQPPDDRYAAGGVVLPTTSYRIPYRRPPARPHEWVAPPLAQTIRRMTRYDDALDSVTEALGAMDAKPTEKAVHELTVRVQDVASLRRPLEVGAERVRLEEEIEDLYASVRARQAHLMQSRTQQTDPHGAHLLLAYHCWSRGEDPTGWLVTAAGAGQRYGTTSDAAALADAIRAHWALDDDDDDDVDDDVGHRGWITQERLRS